jgi:tyrosine-protein phosphatase YwqE
MEPFFSKYGFDVHAAQHGVMIPMIVHQQGIHSSSENWNAVWQRWVDDTKADIASGTIKAGKGQTLKATVHDLVQKQLNYMVKRYYLTKHEKPTLSYTDYKK